jgi:uncharacterized protein (TIGR02145 family)
MMMQGKVIGGKQIKDYDGNIYTSVKIGTQTWLVENLKTTHYNNGDAIPNVTNTDAWKLLNTGALCDYNNTPANSDVYGKLYNWMSTLDVRGLAPSGYHIPSLAELETLYSFLGSGGCGKLKEVGTTNWNTPNTGATDEYGFKALPSGYRYEDGVFYSINEYELFWSTTKATNPYFMFLRYNNSEIYYPFPNTIGQAAGMSIRCIKD